MDNNDNINSLSNSSAPSVSRLSKEELEQIRKAMNPDISSTEQKKSSDAKKDDKSVDNNKNDESSNSSGNTFDFDVDEDENETQSESEIEIQDKPVDKKEESNVSPDDKQIITSEEQESKDESVVNQSVTESEIIDNENVDDSLNNSETNTSEEQEINPDNHEQDANQNVVTESDDENQETVPSDIDNSLENGVDTFEVEQEYQDKIDARDAALHLDELEISQENGSYTSTLDFTKNMSIRKHKLPIPKWPFIIVGAIVLLIISITAVVAVLNNMKPDDPITVISTSLNVDTINAGYVGETLDLRGVYIETIYSDGRVSREYDIEKYITNKSTQFNSSYKIIAASDMSYVEFTYNETVLRLTAKTFNYVVNGFSDVQLEKYTFSSGEKIYFSDLLIMISYGDLGNKVLSVNEIKSNIKITLGGSFLSTQADGFIVTNGLATGPNELLFTYNYNGTNYLKLVNIEIV